MATELDAITGNGDAVVTNGGGGGGGGSGFAQRTALTVTPGPSAKAVAVWSAIGIFAVQGWRVYQARKTGKGSGVGFKQIFAGVVLAVLVAFISDIDHSLGAAFGTAVVIGLIPGGSGNVAGIFTGAFSKVSKQTSPGPYKGPH